MTTQQLNLKLTPELIQRLRERALQDSIRLARSVGVSEVATKALNEFFNPPDYKARYEGLLDDIRALGEQQP